MKKVIYIFLILILLTSILGIQNNVYATDKHTLGEVTSDADGFIKKGESNANNKISQESLKNMSDTIYNILLTVGIIIAFIIGAVLGIKFMTSGAEGQADVKSALMPYGMGCAIVFGAFTIWKIVLVVLQ